MEKILIKTGLYSLVISFFFMTVGFKKSYETVDDNGDLLIEIITYPDFFFNIFRYSIIVSIIVTYIVLFILLIEKKTDRIVELINNTRSI